MRPCPQCGTSSSSTAASSTAPAGEVSTTVSPPTASTSPSCRTRRRRWPATSPPQPGARPARRPGDPRRPLLRRRGRSPKPAATSSVAGLVYIAAFAPDKGESVEHADRRPAARRARAADPAAAATGSCSSTVTKFADAFAADLPAADARVHGRLAGRRGASTRSPATVTEPAWRTKPSWYLVADRGPDDPAAGAARHGRARRRDRRRGHRPATPSTSPSPARSPT